jgi:hypothetical protein
MLGPRFVGAEEFPGGVVEAGSGPAEFAVGIVAGMKSPKVMNLDDGLALVLEVDDLGAGMDGQAREKSDREH